MKEEEAIEKFATQRAAEYSREAVKQALEGYKGHKKAIMWGGIAAVVVWVISVLVFLNGLFALSLSIVLASLALWALSLLLLAASLGGVFWLYQRVLGMVTGKAVELIRDILVFTFGFKEDGIIIRAVMGIGAKFIWRELEKDAAL